MKELKDGAISRIKAVLSVYKCSKKLSMKDRFIVKEYEEALILFSDGYLIHLFYKLAKYVFFVAAGFILFLILHDKFNFFN